MIRPALMFKDRAVLQREKKIAVWGQADPGAQITVQVQGQSVSTVTDDKGNWKVFLAPLQVSFQETMTISDDHETLAFQDLMVGDVWLAGGQSNMEFHMRYDADVEDEKKVCKNPCIRFFDYPDVSFPGQIDMADYGKNYGFWRSCDAENLERFSAVAYYCVKELQKKYQIPVGILGINWGGTSAMAWIPEEVATENGDAHRIEAYHEGLGQMDLDAYDQRFMNDPMSFHTDLLGEPFSDLMMFGCSQEEFVQKISEVMAAQGIDFSTIDPAAFSPVIGPKHEWRPAGVYESMLLPCVPYGVKGVLWYQGCSDSDTEQDAKAYKTVFPALIRHWRELWNDELPFLFVQLAPLDQWMGSVGTYYPITRQAQQWTADHVPGTGMAVITDVGMEWDIHPKKKQPVGYRLALLAENYVYGDKDVLCEAPTLIRAEWLNGQLILTFDHAGTGLYLAETVPYGQRVGADRLGGLQVFTEEGELDLSQAKAVAQNDKVILSGLPEGVKLVRVALARTGWYLVNLYNSAGIPARPAEVDME